MTGFRETSSNPAPVLFLFQTQKSVSSSRPVDLEEVDEISGEHKLIPNFKRPAAPQVPGYTPAPPSTTSSTSNVSGDEVQQFAGKGFRDPGGATQTLFQGARWFTGSALQEPLTFKRPNNSEALY